MKKKFIIEQLEERLMLSADFQPVPFDGGLPDDLSALTVVETPLVPSTSASDNAKHAEYRDEMVFIDSMVSDYQKLVDDIMAQQDNGTHFEVIVLDSSRNGIEQISETLNQYENIDAVHLFSHGSDGAVQLGDTWLNSATLDAHADSIEGWSSSLTGEADIMFYGCDLASGDDGRSLIESLSILTGADIAASTDLTGIKAYGGDWQLEHTVGTIESEVAVSTKLQTNWSYVLIPPTINGTSSGQAVNDKATISPFSGVIIADVDSASVDVTVTVSNPLKGVFSTLNGFSDDGGGVYTFTGSDAAATTAIQGMVFDPTENRVAPGSSENINIQIDVDDGSGPVNDNNTSIDSMSINDAPTLGNGSLGAVTEDTTSPAGDTVTNIFAGQFADIDAGSSFGGIAVVGNTANAGTEGAWQYSTNSGTNWFDISTVADDATALALSSSTLVRFVPVADYNGTPTALTIRGLDNTHAGGYSTTAGVENRINVDTTTNGNTTPIAAVTATLSTSITAANDAPTLGNGSLGAVTEDTTSPAGDTVTNIFAGQFGDIDAGSNFGGIAVVGNTANAGTEGAWQYSTNSGTNWFDISTVADDATALALSSSTLVRFVPVADYNGTPTALTIRGLDNTHAGGYSTTAGVENRINVDTTTNGNTTPIAAVTATLSTLIIADNDAPIGGFSADNVIPQAQITQATNGSGIITINWKAIDGELDNVTLKNFEYSDDGSTWYSIASNSGALSANWDDNGGLGWSTVSDFTNPSFHNFTFDTQHSDLSLLPLAGATTDIQIRFTLNDGTDDSDIPVTSEVFTVDNEIIPTITEAHFHGGGNYLHVRGSNFNTVAPDNTDIKSMVDWNKIIWNINGGPGTITFTESDITSAEITDDDELKIYFTAAKEIAMEAITDFGSDGGADTLTVIPGFFRDAFGNVATTDGTGSSTPPDATNLNANETFTEDALHNFINDIVTSDPDSSTLTVSLELSDSSAGELLTGTVGSATSTFDTVTGIWEVSGDVADVNTLLGNLVFDPEQDYDSDFSITASVSDGLSAPKTGTITMTATPIADTPSVTNATTQEDVLSTSGLVISSNMADGAEVTHFKITGISGGTLYQNDGTTVINNGDFILAGEGNAGLKFLPSLNSMANGSFTVQASTSAADPGLGGNTVNATITVTPIADTPSVTNATTQEDVLSTSGLVISSNAADGAEVTHFKITGISGGTLYQNDGTTVINNGDFILAGEGNAGLKFLPSLNSMANGSFTVQASTSAADPGLGGNTVNATITVTPIADTPSVTNATTQEDVLSTSGLVISSNAADGAEVTHFKITGISGGTLYQNDGTTVINNGDFILAGEGNAGLKFLPSLNSMANGSFTVQASTSAADPGLGGNTVNATIIVTPVGDTPQVANITTSEDTQSGLIVINRNANDGAEVTHFRISGITNGTLFKSDGTTVISNGDYITFAEAQAGLKFTPSLNSNANGSFNVESSENGTSVTAQSGVATSTVTITPVGDTPDISNTSAPPGTLSDPIVISPNASDGVEVTHFQITGITNGTLYHADGTTPINNGDYITMSQAQDGLKFQIASGSVFGSFNVRPSKDGVSVDPDSGYANPIITALSAPTVPDADVVPDEPVEEDPEINEDTIADDPLNDSAIKTALSNTSSQKKSFIQSDASAAKGGVYESQVTVDFKPVMERLSRIQESESSNILSVSSLEQQFNKLMNKLPDFRISYVNLKNSLDDFRKEADMDMQDSETVIGSAIAVSTGLSVGYVVWMIRGGMLLSSMISSMPAWQLADPLPILKNTRNDDDDDDDESLETIIKNSSDNDDKKKQGPDRTGDSIND